MDCVTSFLSSEMQVGGEEEEKGTEKHSHESQRAKENI